MGAKVIRIFDLRVFLVNLNAVPLLYLPIKNRITGIIKKKLKLAFDSDRKRFFTTGKSELKKDFGYSPKITQESIGG